MTSRSDSPAESARPDKAGARAVPPGQAFFSFGFRPFFLGASLWSALAMAVWIGMLSGAWTVPTALDPVSWHAHEFLFGYLGAVIAGFLMTAIPNWTGRKPIAGWPLAALFGLWLVGRIAIGASAYIGAPLVALADIGFAVVLAAVMTAEIVAGRNWRNLIVIALLAVFIAGNALFHWEAAQGYPAAQGFGLRLGLAATVGLIALIGGRIVPAFTRNWLAKRDKAHLVTPPMQRFDKAALLVLGLSLAVWVIWPIAPVTGVALLVAGALHTVRLARWGGTHTGADPLVWVLHVAYACIPLGAFDEAISIAWPHILGAAPALHLWMAGGIGLMTLAVMTRASLGHTGRPLVADAGTLAIYLCLIGAVIARVLAGAFPVAAGTLHSVSGVLWVAAFGGFALLYGPMLLRPRV
ncbi:MAG: NnrS family protein [Pseudomonadota bacterium]